MSSAACQHSIEHLRAVAQVLEDLTACHEFFEHQYHAEAFGSWVLVAGKPKRRYRFTWDGKDAFLSVAVAQFFDSQTPAQWHELPGKGGHMSSLVALANVNAVLGDAA